MVASPEDLEVPDGTEVFIHRKALDKDVLALYYHCVRRYRPDYVVRITSDCPVLDPFLVEYVVSKAVEHKADYCSNVLYPLTFPDGQDVEVMSYNLVEFLHDAVKDKSQREHVTLAFRENTIWQNSFKTVDIRNTTNYSGIKMSVDYPKDIKAIEDGGYV